MTTSACYPETFPIAFQHPNPELRDATYPRLSIDAHDDTVLFVWNICADVDLDRPCENFRLLYTGSTNNGDSLDPTPKEVRSDLQVNWIDFSAIPLIPGSDNWPTLLSSYASHARPSVALDENGLPHVAWHVQTDAGYVISTTYATSGTLGNYEWIDGTTWQIGDGTDARIAPTILDVDHSLDTQDALHTFLLKAWQDDVDGHPVSRSQIYYDYLGSRRPVLEATQPQAAYTLPQQRVSELRVQAVDAGGFPVPNHPVVFETDHGSFSYQGFGAQSQVGTTDSQGWATASLYTNLAGEANVQVWLDLTTNQVWEVGEPRAYMTRTWTASWTPTLLVHETQVTAGDLITTTLMEHPYESASQPGQAVPYHVWWCPKSGATGSPSHLLGPINVDIATWGYKDALVQIPATADGTYYIETRSASEATPCSATDRVAIAQDVSVTAAPIPTQDPWLSIDDNEPKAGGTVMVGVHNHPAATYGIWWCPANDEAAQVEQQVGTAVIQGGGDISTPVQVPIGVSGLYRLESHTVGGYCGNTSTRQCSSTLLAPFSGVFLPLISRGH
jgi:hypothetical protein